MMLHGYLLTTLPRSGWIVDCLSDGFGGGSGRVRGPEYIRVAFIPIFDYKILYKIDKREWKGQNLKPQRSQQQKIMAWRRKIKIKIGAV
jgi:hypothetical protein